MDAGAKGVLATENIGAFCGRLIPWPGRFRRLVLALKRAGGEDPRVGSSKPEDDEK